MAERLRALWDSRAEGLGLTQERAGAKMKMSQGSIGHLLAGRNALNVEHVLWFADLLHVHPDEIDPDIAERVPPMLREFLGVLPRSRQSAALTYQAQRGPIHAIGVHEPKSND